MVDHITTFAMMRKCGISFGGAHILVLLRKKPHTQSQLATVIGSSRPTICSNITTLLEKKLVMESEYRPDLKGKPITLTDAGTAMCLTLFGNP